MRKVVIVAGCESYRVGDFLKAATVLRLRPVVATDAVAPVWSDAGHVAIDLGDPASAAARVLAAVPDAAGVVAAEDVGVEIAALVARALDLPHSSPEAATATRNKNTMRAALEAAGVAQPRFAAVRPGGMAKAAAAIGFPVVVKPVGLSASRGVLRADNTREAERAEARVRAILLKAGLDGEQVLLVEQYVSGIEVAVEGLLVDGELQVLAVIDKPDPLEGPTFEETLFVTPSRLSESTQQRAVARIEEAADALGLRSGPIHGEVRIDASGRPLVLEVAARTIGGLCARALTFDLLGESLEVIVLRGALGAPSGGRSLSRPASGVLMLPVPASGVLTGIEGIEGTHSLDGVDDVVITIPLGSRVEALPEGGRYLGFVFASGGSAGSVEHVLREAAASLVITIDGEDVDSDGITALL